MLSYLSDKMRHQILHEEIIDGFKYCVINEDYFQHAVDFFFEVYLKDEPTRQSFGGYDYRHPKILKEVEDVISDGVSIMTLDTNQNNKLVGIRLAYTVTRYFLHILSSYSLELFILVQGVAETSC